MRRLRLLEGTVFWLFTAGALALVFLLMLSPRFISLAGLSRELDATHGETQALFRRICSARADICAMRKSPYFVEKTARLELGLRSAGEKEMILATTLPEGALSSVTPSTPGALEYVLAPFVEDPLFRSAVFLTAVSMLFVALVGMSQPAAPLTKARRGPANPSLRAGPESARAA